MAVFSIRPLDVTLALDHYVVPVIMVWFVVRWFFQASARPAMPDLSRASEKAEKAVVHGAGLGLILAACLIGLYQWFPGSTQGGGIGIVGMAATGVVGVVLGYAIKSVSDSSSPRTRAATAVFGTGLGLASLVIYYSANRCTHETLMCAYLAIVIGYYSFHLREEFQ